jgi:cell wall-associated NlpC family hydrolase
VADRYAGARPMRVLVPLAPLTLRPDGEGPMDTQLLYGEGFAVYERTGEWSWGQAESDGYVGYIPSACLMDDGPAPTHRASQPMTHVYPDSAVRSRPIGWLTYGALVRVEGVEAGFAALGTGGFVPRVHLAPIDATAADWVAEAERFLGAPYLWGGRSPVGVDCSALVQIARQAAGLACPRDSDMQRDELGRTLPERSEPKRGDLVFWKGHVGIMLDATRLLHANGHHMAVAIEPLETARARILAAGEGPVLRNARLDEAGKSG